MTDHHLVVLVHGLWGGPEHLNHLREKLQERNENGHLHILMPKTNAAACTYDGVNICGERVTHEVEQEMRELAQQGIHVKKISVCGYSLGGLIARYCIGLLYKNGIFDDVDPVNFTTFATPHLGVKSPGGGLYDMAFNLCGPIPLGQSGQQMFLADRFLDTNRPLLALMADPDNVFMKGLARFRNRSIYVNIVNDRSVPYFTGAMSTSDPYVNLDKVNLNYLDDELNLEDPVLLDPANPVTPYDGPSSPLDFVLVFEMLRSNLPWYAISVLLLPVVLLGFAASSLWSGYQSAKRVQLHESGKAGIKRGRYRMPFLDEAEAMQNRITGPLYATTEKYLPTPPPELATSASEAGDKLDGASSIDGEEVQEQLLKEKRSNDAVDAESAADDGDDNNDDKDKVHVDNNEGLLLSDASAHFPTMKLDPEQFFMAANLNALGFKKYPVHIKTLRHSHAVIVRRMERESFAEGKVVIAHWARGFEV